jgi:hypothetical protein
LLGASWLGGAGGASALARNGDLRYDKSQSGKNLTSTAQYYALGKAAYTSHWSDLFGR